MVGDRYLTDVVFGNRNAMLTVRPAPFTSAGEPKAVLLVRDGGMCRWGNGCMRVFVLGVRNCMLLLPRVPASCLRLPRTRFPQARSVEESCVGRWRRAGVQPPPHPLAPDAAAVAAFLRHPDEWR